MRIVLIIERRLLQYSYRWEHRLHTTKYFI
jgi:hypothetical protein